MADETPNPEPVAQETQEQTVPYERFAQKVSELKSLQKQVAEMSQLNDVVKAWESKYDELQGKYNESSANFQQTEALLRAGIMDDDVADLARYRFSKNEAEDFAEWLSSAAKEDSVLKVHLQKPATEQVVQEVKPTPPPQANKGTKQSPVPPQSEISPENIQNMSIEDLKKNYAKVASAWGYTPHDLTKL